MRVLHLDQLKISCCGNFVSLDLSWIIIEGITLGQLEGSIIYSQNFGDSASGMITGPHNVNGRQSQSSWKPDRLAEEQKGDFSIERL